jgi:hypothetical protein
VAPVVAFAGVLVTAVVTYVGTRRRLLDDLAHDYDLALRANRVEVYPALWALTEALPRYGRPGDVSISDLQQLIGKLRDWYFETGGLFLTAGSRDAYFELQEELASTTRDRDAHEAIGDEDRERLRVCGSTLRTALAADIHSRRTARLSQAEHRP